MYELPYGNTQQLNLDWFIKRWQEFYAQWQATEAGIDHALDAEVQRVEDAMTDLYAARDAAAASATAAAASATSASNDATIAANAATAAAASATLANTKATAAGLSEAAAALSASQAANDATAAATSASQASASASSATDSAQAAATSEQNIESIIEDAIQDAEEAATAAAGSASDAADSAAAAAASAASIVVDSAMSDSSTNPVQNKVINGELTELKSVINYDIIKMPYYVNRTYATGWRQGFYDCHVGDTLAMNNTSKNYMRYHYAITPSRYPDLEKAAYIEITPPSGYSVRIFEYNPETQVLTAEAGAINSETHPELLGKTQRLAVTQGRNYGCDIGKFNDNSPSYLNSTFVDTIILNFLIPKEQNPYKKRTGDYEFFTVNIEEPMAFGGEEVNTTSYEVEAVLRLPSSYSVIDNPSTLVLMCHGQSTYIDASTSTWGSSDWKALCDALLDAGFALFDVNVLPTSTGTTQMGFCVGSPLAVKAAKAAYDYITTNYNVKNKIFVHGSSMGGTLASSFVQAYPQLCLAQSSFAGRDLSLYLKNISDNTVDYLENLAASYGYESFSALNADKFSHAESLAPVLSLNKYNSGVVTFPPDRATNYTNWLTYYAEIQTHEREDAIGDYTAYRSVPYKSWNSWADSEEQTKAEQILHKAYTNGGSAPYLCVFYDSGTHSEMTNGSINNMHDQLVAWFRRWQ